MLFPCSICSWSVFLRISRPFAGFRPSRRLSPMSALSCSVRALMISISSYPLTTSIGGTNMDVIVSRNYARMRCLTPNGRTADTSVLLQFLRCRTIEGFALFFIYRIYNIFSRPGAIIYFVNPLTSLCSSAIIKTSKREELIKMTYENIKEIYQDIIDLWGEDLGGQIVVAIHTAPHVDITYQDFMR